MFKNEEEFWESFDITNSQIEHDNHGQIVLYTNWFKWDDGTIRSTPQPKSRNVDISSEEIEEEEENFEVDFSEEEPKTLRSPPAQYNFFEGLTLAPSSGAEPLQVVDGTIFNAFVDDF